MPNIQAKIYVGFELECAELSSNALRIINTEHFLARHDGSVTSPFGEPLPSSREIITLPIEVDVTANQDGNNIQLNLAAVESSLRALCKCASEVNASCGFHVHLGRPGNEQSSWGCPKSDWGPERSRTMLVIGSFLEKQLYELCPPSRMRSAYCVPIKQSYTRNELCSYYPVGAKLPDNKYDCLKRRCWLNLVETRRHGSDERLLYGRSLGLGTIEIRMLGNVRRFDYIYSWAKLWLKIAAYVAYLPSSLAILHCVVANSIENEINEVARLKDEKTVELS